jgi:FG-GAP-like repeat/Galactose oxidase, central domain/Kelch motif
MKTEKNIVRNCLRVVLGLIGLLGMTTFAPQPVALAQNDPSWITTGSLNIARSNYTATLLADGRVLVVGGYSYVDYNNLSSAELYDPATGTWGSTGSLNIPRSGHTATLLANGKVLVAGGDQDGSSAELFDPSSGTWSVTGSLNIARFGHTATLLQSGKVLIAGGGGGDGRAELYDPATGTWSITGGLITDRGGQTATLLQNGQVLIAGGWFDEGDGIASFVASAELYDPATGTWSVTGNLNAPRSSHTATLLPDGRVLIAAGVFTNWAPDKGGFAVSPTSLNSAELYDPATGTWSVTASLNTLRTAHTATLLPNGKVLVAGGFYWTIDGNTPNDGTFPCGDIWTCRAKALDTAEIYDPATRNWTATVNLNAARFEPTATRLQNGQVLVAGGDSLGSAELYDSHRPAPVDFDGDGKSDITVYRDGMWYVAQSSDGGQTSVGWGGAPQDKPVPADYDGDGKTDMAVYRDGTWFIFRSSDGGQIAEGWGGLPQDIPVPADFDGDGKVDIAVYRDGMWFIIRSSDGGVTATGWGGAPEDIPLN